MPSGPEHYREAERLITDANHAGPDDLAHARAIAAADVHAALALAAATALSAYGTMPVAEYQAWRDVCGEAEEAAMAAGEGNGNG